VPHNPQQFDPYHKWLGIPPKDQPADHYRLLAIERFEADPEVIETAANVRMAYLHGCTTGEQCEIAERLLNEIAAARVCLLDARKKADYDARLRAKRPASSPAPPPLAPLRAPPVPSAPPRFTAIPGRQAGQIQHPSPKQQANITPQVRLVRAPPAAPRVATRDAKPGSHDAIDSLDLARIAVASNERTARARRTRWKFLVAASVSFLAVWIVFAVVDARQRQDARPAADASVAPLVDQGPASASKATDTPAAAGSSPAPAGAASPADASAPAETPSPASVQPSPEPQSPPPTVASSPSPDPSPASGSPASREVASASPAPNSPPAPSPPAHEVQAASTSPKDVAPVDPWTDFNLDGNQVIDDLVRVTHGRLSTKLTYAGDIEITVVARTNKNNIRLRAFENAQVIWNWEVNPNELRVHRPDDSQVGAPVEALAPNKWYRLTWRIKRRDVYVLVNGRTVFHERPDRYLARLAPVCLETGDGSVVDVKSFEVRSLRLDRRSFTRVPPAAIARPAPRNPATRAKKPKKGKVLYHVWEWHNADFAPFKLKFFVDGSANRFNETKGNPSMKWSRDGQAFVLRWPEGWYDAMTVSANGREMRGQNQNGTKVNAIYIGTNLDAK